MRTDNDVTCLIPPTKKYTMKVFLEILASTTLSQTFVATSSRSYSCGENVSKSRIMWLSMLGISSKTQPITQRTERNCTVTYKFIKTRSTRRAYNFICLGFER